MAHGVIGSKVKVELKRLNKTEALRIKTEWFLHATKGWRFYKRIKDVILLDKKLVISIPCVNQQFHSNLAKGSRNIQVRP